MREQKLICTSQRKSFEIRAVLTKRKGHQKHLEPSLSFVVDPRPKGSRRASRVMGHHQYYSDGKRNIAIFLVTEFNTD